MTIRTLFFQQFRVLCVTTLLFAGTALGQEGVDTDPADIPHGPLTPGEVLRCHMLKDLIPLYEHNVEVAQAQYDNCVLQFGESSCFEVKLGLETWQNKLELAEQLKARCEAHQYIKQMPGAQEK